MTVEEMIQRINMLYHKSQKEGLSEEEKKEQASLRQAYVANVRANLRGQLNHIDIVREDGSIENLGEKYNKKAESKADIRRRVLSYRDALAPEERIRAQALLTKRIREHDWYIRAGKILLFAGCGSEVDTTQLMEETLHQGKELYLPRVNPVTREMAFYRVYALSDLSEGYHGILEPADTPDAEIFMYRPGKAQETLMLMPGVAFDGLCNRIGYGGGFYDRFLANKSELPTIAIGFECQMVAYIANDVHDVKPMQVICL